MKPINQHVRQGKGESPVSTDKPRTSEAIFVLQGHNPAASCQSGLATGSEADRPGNLEVGHGLDEQLPG